jgi:3-hydroxybutyryl-CoA dehydrogenase
MEEAIARVRLEPDLEKAARDADFVIEAIVERLEPKRECFAKLDRLCPPHAILATNSSTLMNSQIASATKRPDKCVNMHYFYPPLVMKLVEVVKGQATTEETVAITAGSPGGAGAGRDPSQRAARLPRQPHPARARTRGVLLPRAGRGEPRRYRQGGGAGRITPGPLPPRRSLRLDIGYNARLETCRSDPNDAAEGAREAREAGRFDRKTGRGFYDYSTDPPEADPD